MTTPSDSISAFAELYSSTLKNASVGLGALLHDRAKVEERLQVFREVQAKGLELARVNDDRRITYAVRHLGHWISGLEGTIMRLDNPDHPLFQ